MAQHCTEKERYEIIAYRKLGKSIREISRLSCIPYTTVWRTIKKYEDFNTVSHLCGNGRHRSFSPRLKKLILKEIDINQKTSCRKLAKKAEEELGMTYSHSSIRNYLHSMDLYSFPAVKKPFLRPIHIHNRYEASKRWIKMPEERVKTMIFSDESKFNLHTL